MPPKPRASNVITITTAAQLDELVEGYAGKREFTGWVRGWIR